MNSLTDLNEKQTKILLVAEKLFAEKGFDGTSIRNIAQEAQINIAMVSYYFGSKEKMLESLILHRIEDIKMQVENLSRAHISPVEKINRFVELYIQTINKHKCFYQILLFEQSSKKREIDFQSFSEVKKANLEIFKKIIAEGQEQGVFKQNVNVALIPSTIIGTLVHFRMSRPHYEHVLDLHTEEAYENYIKTELTQHVKQTIQSLLKYEN
ncbi:MAG: TetR/AcrR family transcriptional regulator [Bacteroidetes bacterium]|nr:TetR/AcrR family transcriptional regulator [Bacteroidota bacterium]